MRHPSYNGNGHVIEPTLIFMGFGDKIVEYDAIIGICPDRAWITRRDRGWNWKKTTQFQMGNSTKISYKMDVSIKPPFIPRGYDGLPAGKHWHNKLEHGPFEIAEFRYNKRPCFNSYVSHYHYQSESFGKNSGSEIIVMCCSQGVILTSSFPGVGRLRPKVQNWMITTKITGITPAIFLLQNHAFPFSWCLNPIKSPKNNIKHR